MTKKKVGSAIAKLIADVQSVSPEKIKDIIDQNTNNINQKDFKNFKVYPQKFDSELLIKKIRPADCELWEFADRPEDELGDIDELAQSIKLAGQLEPILVRPMQDGKYQIVFGNRRWRACKLLNIDLLAIVKEINDKDAALIQKFENSERENISNLAMARSSRKLIDGGIFSSELELSKHLNISPQALNDLFAYLRVPDSLSKRIVDFKNLSKKLVVKLATLSKKEKVLELLLDLSDLINSGKITVKNIDAIIDKRLNGLTESLESSMKPLFLKDKNNQIVLKLNVNKNGSYNVKISEKLASKISLEKLKKTFEELYQLEQQ